MFCIFKQYIILFSSVWKHFPYHKRNKYIERKFFKTVKIKWELFNPHRDSTKKFLLLLEIKYSCLWGLDYCNTVYFDIKVLRFFYSKVFLLKNWSSFKLTSKELNIWKALAWVFLFLPILIKSELTRGLI